MLEFYSPVYRMKLLSFLKRWNGLNSIPQPSPLCTPAICSMIQLSVYWWAISPVSKGWTLTKMKHVSFNSPPPHQAYKLLFLLFPISPPVVSPPLHPKAAHLPHASLKPKNIKKLQDEGGGNFLWVFLDSPKSRQIKNYDKNNSNDKPRDTDGLSTYYCMVIFL